MVLIIFSIIVGIILSLSRLSDLRLSRHIALTNFRIFKKKRHFNKKEDEYQAENFLSRIYCLWNVNIKYEIFKIKKSDIKSLDDSELYEKLKQLHQMSTNLGSLSWSLLFIEFLLLLVSIILFFIAFLIYNCNDNFLVRIISYFNI